MISTDIKGYDDVALILLCSQQEQHKKNVDLSFFQVRVVFLVSIIIDHLRKKICIINLHHFTFKCLNIQHKLTRNMFYKIDSTLNTPSTSRLLTYRSSTHKDICKRTYCVYI